MCFAVYMCLCIEINCYNVDSCYRYLLKQSENHRENKQNKILLIYKC